VTVKTSARTVNAKPQRAPPTRHSPSSDPCEENLPDLMEFQDQIGYRARADSVRPYSTLQNRVEW
jgi:hypothetical protein